MTLGIGLILGAPLIAALGPRYLCRLLTPAVQPGLALAAWIGSAAAMWASALAGAAILAIPGGTEVDGLLGMARNCLNAATTAGPIPWAQVVAVVLATSTGIAVLRWAMITVQLAWRDRRRRAEQLSLLRLVCRREDSVFWLEEDAPMAFSLGGRAGVVVATTAVARLTGPRRAAIVAHEHAHLRGRHHLLVLLADATHRALPFAPLCRQLPAVVRVLVEVAADAAAARECGAETVSDALADVADGHAPIAALGASNESVADRRAWLHRQRPASRWARSRAGLTLAATASTGPLAASVGCVAGLVLLACPTF
ncbi:M56 family metallopeptidase [Pseudonocardia hispaniensis]|uniref:M56 family metallopeptidase n=1 Tax=Pseudonocardia hispaniensis TaxID=904933 RepID=A0ABW1J7R2_9PSEU